MLSFLKIENLAIVPSLSLEFGPGFNVLSGETGAGKSIIVDAVGLLLGERGSTEMIRTGADRLVVEGLFEIGGGEGLPELLGAIGIEAGEEGLILRREFTSAGRSRAFVNGTLVTLQQLREVGDHLADLHGQSPHQSLLLPEGQREILDRFAGAEEAAAEVRSAAAQLKELLDEREYLSEKNHERVRLADALRAEIREIEEAAPSAEEEIELQRQESLLRHAEEVARLASEASDLLNEADVSAISLLGAAKVRLRRLAEIDDTCVEALQAVEEALLAMNEAIRIVEPYREQSEFDPARQDWVASRLASFDRLKRKYGASLNDVVAYLARARDELAALGGAEKRLEAIDAEVERAASVYAAAAAALSGKRVSAARQMRQAIQPELKALAMRGCTFEVAFEPYEEAKSAIEVSGRRIPCRREGLESVEFLIAPNPGEEARPLARIASGGELSRIMLALRTIAKAGGDGRTLIFDEVDAGVGGVTADALARRLKKLAARHQVLCVTHLPQVAAKADRHFRVEKLADNGRTRAQVTSLSGGERVEELARMIGSPEAPTARRHAAALISGRKQP